MSDKQPIRPSVWYYVLSAVVILSGLGFFVYTLFHEISHLTDNLIQVVVPGEKALNLQPKLRYTIFLEEDSVVDGRIYSTKSNLAGLTCTVTSLATGKRIDTHRATMSTTYNVGGRSGRSVLEFVTVEAGVYQLACNYEEGTQGPEAVLAVGSGVAEGILGLVMRSLASFFGGWFLGGAIFLTVFIKRERAKKRMAQTAAAPQS